MRSTLFLSALVCLSASIPAAADTIQYVFTPDPGSAADSVSFTLPSDVTPTYVGANGTFFEADTIATINGVTAPDSIELFAGGFLVFNENFDFEGAPLFTGDNAHPTLTLTTGAYDQVGERDQDIGTGTLVVSDLSTVTPEPSSILLLGTGVLAAANTLRRRIL